MANQGVGASIARKEDDRLMRGRGRFVGDFGLAGQLEAAFVRSPVAHARIGANQHPRRHPAARVFIHADMEGVKPIRAVSALPGFKPSAQPALAAEKVRQVGETIAVCVAETRAEAEDMADRVAVDFEILPAVSDMLAARDPDAPLIHEQWGDNVFLETDRRRRHGGGRRPRRGQGHARGPHRAPVHGADRGQGRIRRMGPEAPPAHRDVGRPTSPHRPQRNGRMPRASIIASVRVIAPDVGGGFGYKGILAPEEVCVAWLARRLERPVRWLEDRREHLTANANCREHHYIVTGYADADGKLLGLEAEATVDAGAYSAYPFSACLEAAQVAARSCRGLTLFDTFRCRTWSISSNKPPILPYPRGGASPASASRSSW